MITAAKSSISTLTDSHSSSSLEYRVGSAEDLSFAKEESIDLITAGQAAHWFNHDKVYPELMRILKPGGTVAYWGYSYLFLPEHGQEATRAIYDFGLKQLGQWCKLTDEDSGMTDRLWDEMTGSYWESGRKGPESLYDILPFPASQGWDSTTFARQKFDRTTSSAYIPLNGDAASPPHTEHFPISMRKTMSLQGLREQFKTWSSVHNYMQEHKEEKHVVDAFIDEKLRKCLGEAGKDENMEIEVQWPLGLMLMKKRA